jgi:hypothetical protein
MVGKLSRLPAETQNALQQLACLGNSAEFAMLRMAYHDIGTDWPLRPTRDEVLQEYDRIWSLVGRRQIEELVDLPIQKS